MSMELEGISFLLDELKNIEARHEKKVIQELIKSGKTTQANAEDAAPVATGYLKSSGYTAVPLGAGGEFYVEVGFDAPYAIDVEEGHMSRAGTPVPAQPFLLPAFYDEADALEPRLEALNEKLGE